MAGDWIKMRTELDEEPEVVALAARQKAHECHIVGALHKLWSLGDKHTTDGILRGYTPDVLDRKVGMPGFSQALADVGWLEIKPEGLCIPRFDSHNGESAKKRVTNSKRAQMSRNKRDKCSATSATKALPDKIREDNNINTHTTPNQFALADRVTEFLVRWNATPGTHPCPDQFAMGRPDLLIQRFGNPAWLENYPRALEKFPLKAMPQVSVSKFLEEDTVPRILNGFYDFTPRQSGSSQRPQSARRGPVLLEDVPE